MNEPTQPRDEAPASSQPSADPNAEAAQGHVTDADVEVVDAVEVEEVVEGVEVVPDEAPPVTATEDDGPQFKGRAGRYVASSKRRLPGAVRSVLILGVLALIVGGIIGAVLVVDLQNDHAAFAEAQKSNTAHSYGEYLEAYPKGAHAEEATRLQRECAQAAHAEKLAYYDENLFGGGLASRNADVWNHASRYLYFRGADSAKTSGDKLPQDLPGPALAITVETVDGKREIAFDAAATAELLSVLQPSLVSDVRVLLIIRDGDKDKKRVDAFDLDERRYLGGQLLEPLTVGATLSMMRSTEPPPIDEGEVLPIGILADADGGATYHVLPAMAGADALPNSAAGIAKHAPVSLQELATHVRRCAVPLHDQRGSSDLQLRVVATLDAPAWSYREVLMICADPAIGCNVHDVGIAFITDDGIEAFDTPLPIDAGIAMMPPEPIEPMEVSLREEVVIVRAPTRVPKQFYWASADWLTIEATIEDMAVAAPTQGYAAELRIEIKAGPMLGLYHTLRGFQRARLAHPPIAQLPTVFSIPGALPEPPRIDPSDLFPEDD